MIEVINRRRVMAIGAVATLAVAGFSLKAEAGTEDQAKAMVAKAIALYDEKGDAAFKVFGEGKASGFLEGDVYIVVQSRGPEGKVLARHHCRSLGQEVRDADERRGHGSRWLVRL
ncbi:MAG: hypothetical protein NTZ54_14425 [Alphaproteobacteria bacterium]|nr:hypothetical protein [Alphaproteobacteria bacterium]